MRRVLSVIASVLCTVQAWGATWYVRNAGDGEYGLENGGSYANAFDGFADVTWGVGGVQAGDTLVMCGPFDNSSSSTSNTRMLNITGSGSSGSEIILDGNCASQGGASKAVLDGIANGGAGVMGVRTQANTYLRFRNMEVRNFTTRGFTLYATAATDAAIAKFITIESTVEIHDITAAGSIGVEISGTDVAVHGAIHDIGSDAVFCYSCGNGVFTDLAIWNVSKADALGDCLQLQRNSSGDLVDNVYCDKTNVDSKQCVVASTLDSQSYSMRVSRLTCLMMPGGTLSIGVYAEGQMLLENSFIDSPGTYGATGALNNSAKLTVRSVIVRNPRVGCVDVHKTSVGPAADIFNIDCLLNSATAVGVDATAATATISVKNSVFAGTGASALIRGASGTTDSNNNVFGTFTTPYSNNGSTGSTGANDKAVDPQWAGGPNPATAEGFCLGSGSALLGAGTYIGAWILGYGNESLTNPPPIGARGTCRPRSVASARRAASSRVAN